MAVTSAKSYLGSNPVLSSCGQSHDKPGSTVCQRHKPPLGRYTGDALTLRSSSFQVFKAAFPGGSKPTPFSTRASSLRSCWSPLCGLSPHALQALRRRRSLQRPRLCPPGPRGHA